MLTSLAGRSRGPAARGASGRRSPQEVALYVEASVPSKLSGCETTLERGLYEPCTNSSASRPPAALTATSHRPRR